METGQILKDIVVQGTLMDYDTDVYKSVMERMKDNSEFPDPFARLVSVTFQLCREGSIDPWNVDLQAFTRIFRSIIDDSFDRFGMAGYLISQAWKILLEKTEYSVMKRQPPEEPQSEDNFMEDEMAYSRAQLEVPPLDLAEPVKHTEKRPVMLVELLETMRTAMKKDPRRSRKREQVEVHDISAMEDIIFELNQEEPEREIDETYSRILSQFSDTFYMEDLWGQSVEDRWSFFVYCLFLMRDRRIVIKQEDPYGPIVIERVTGAENRMVNV